MYMVIKRALMRSDDPHPLPKSALFGILRSAGLNIAIVEHQSAGTLEHGDGGRLKGMTLALSPTL